MISGHDDEWVTLSGGGPGGEGTVVDADRQQHPHEAGGALLWMVIVAMANAHPCMAVGGGPSRGDEERRGWTQSGHKKTPLSLSRPLLFLSACVLLQTRVCSVVGW
ncbi:hypothetical protein E2C01_033212 [Portunus trituberculatus]|uniref:Uncharacterized protein n=1 Tax=Portunus trituberculatus TaxID=210409 RepID=A0A5B7F2U8_PORTR|nr:hypothetical protein [Portunus trituberculatus]